MKLTQRERILLVVLAVAVILIGGYYLVIKPQMDKIEQLKSEQTTLKVQYDEFVAAMDPKHPIYKQTTIADTKVRQVCSLFFPELKQEKFILLLSEQMKTAGIDADDITFTDIVSGIDTADEEAKDTVNVSPESQVLKGLQTTYLGKSVDKPVDAEALSKQKAEITQLLGNVERQSITLNYNGDFNSFLLFLETLESYSRRIVVDNVAMTNDELGSQQSMIQLSYYAIPKLHEQDADFMEWNLMGPYGKPDPFYGDFVPNSSKNTSTSIPSAAVKSDFFMMLNPITSDLTTFIMSKMDDRSRQSYIYADNESFEPVTFEVTSKDGKYYYTYKSSSEKYPTNDVPVEFKPNGNSLRVQVMSSLRVGTTDLSGVKLTVVNKTDKSVVLEIYNDDVKSRLQLAKSTGSVSIVKK